MEAKESKIIAAVSTAVLTVLLAILYLILGLSKTFFLIAAIDAAVILSILIWLLSRHAALHLRLRSMARRTSLDCQELRLEYSFLRKVAGLPVKFRYEAIQTATDNFHSLIGRGSSGSVYKGILDDGTSVAVKRIQGGEYGDREFRSEVAAVAAVQHVNLVRLFGYCLIPGGMKLLVYDYVENGSLAEWIFPSGKRGCLPWAERRRAAVDVARALAYLHRDCRSRVLHLDVKPENILLDSGFRAVVTDFGLSRMMGREESRVVASGVRGTRGYLAPEWLVGGGVSEKCDVYSYGMVVLEMVGGRRSVRREEEGRGWSYLPAVVAEKVGEGRVMEVVDGRVVGEAEEEEVRRMVFVGLWCVRERAEKRPTMEKVVEMLEGRAEVAPPPEEEMMMVDLLSGEYEPVVRESRRSTASIAASVISGR